MISLCTASLLTSPLYTQPAQALIFGSDQLIEVQYIDGKSQVPRLSSTGMLVENSKLIERTDSIQLTQTPMADKVQELFGHPLCSFSILADAGVSGFCTAFLISDDLALTAGHCVTDQITNSSMVFDHEMKNGRASGTLNQNQVYQIEKVEQRIYSNFGVDVDFAVLRLKTKTDRSPIPISKSPLRLGQTVGSPSHPQGLPMVWLAGRVLETTSEYFRTDQEVSFGSSGSPVLDRNGSVVGLIITGSQERDFSQVHDRQCFDRASARVDDYGHMTLPKAMTMELISNRLNENLKKELGL